MFNDSYIRESGHKTASAIKTGFECKRVFRIISLTTAPLRQRMAPKDESLQTLDLSPTYVLLAAFCGARHSISAYIMDAQSHKPAGFRSPRGCHWDSCWYKLHRCCWSLQRDLSSPSYSLVVLPSAERVDHVSDFSHWTLTDGVIGAHGQPDGCRCALRATQTEG